jgi:hypothetical protein
MLPQKAGEEAITATIFPCSQTELDDSTIFTIADLNCYLLSRYQKQAGS